VWFNLFVVMSVLLILLLLAQTPGFDKYLAAEQA
jgi:hypothetical protein